MTKKVGTKEVGKQFDPVDFVEPVEQPSTPKVLPLTIEVKFGWRDCIAFILGGRARIEASMSCEKDPGNVQVTAQANVVMTPTKQPQQQKK